jgi:transposase
VEVELPNTIEDCHSLIRQLLLVIEKQQAEIDELKAEVRELRARLDQNSQNSNRPPSSDVFTKPRPALRKKKRKKGGQKGHPGKTLKRVAEPDVVIECEPSDCVCGVAEWRPESEIIDSRQVFEIPEPKLEVVEYRRIRRVCRCGREVCGEFPAEVSAPVQYGRGVQAMVALLSVHGCLSYEKIGRLFADLYGYQLNTATTQAMVERTSRVMPIEDIKAGIIASKVANFDETGIRVNGRGNWLHNASTERLTYQFVHSKRGREALWDEKSVLPDFRGIAMHDCWPGYFKFEQIRHAVCHAHILRELNGLIEGGGSNWGRKMKRLLLRMYKASDYGRGVIEDIAGYEKSFGRILRQAEREEPPPEKTNSTGRLKRTKGRNLLERLSKHREAVFRFAREKEVPFTNNQAERDIRPAKIKQKINGGFRSSNGSESYCRINSFISTLRKQKREVFQELLSVIKGNTFEVYVT